MNTNFDSKLREIPHYKRYPAMIPFVGDHYEYSEHLKVLLLGGNYYFEEEVSAHHDADAWYKGSQNDLDKKHIPWIDCRGLVNGDWKLKGYRIYKVINDVIESVCFGKDGRGIDHVAFMNAFQRPSKYGETIKKELVPIDIKVGSDVIRSVIDILEPDCVVFVHKRGWDEFQSSIDTADNPKTDWVYHAGDNRWWNRKNYRYAEGKLINILKRLKMNTKFDSKLKEIPHYKRYPAMIPFVGNHYESSEHRKVLLVGGNFYFKEEVPAHPDADAWYKGSQDDLCKEHIRRIDCRGLVGGDWEPKNEYGIYRNIDKVIRSVGFGTVKKDKIRGIDHVAFMNAFQRPSKLDKTIKKEELAQIDIDVGSDVIKKVIDILEPDCVVFVHKRGWDEFHLRIDTAVKPKIYCVYHAGHNQWWPRELGKAEFIKILKEFKN